MNKILTVSSSQVLRMYPIAEVQRIVGGKSRSTIYRWISAGIFPEPTRIGGNSIAWPEEVIAEWRKNIINQQQNIGATLSEK